MCNCADEINRRLVEKNTRFTRVLVFSSHHPDNPNLLIETEQVETGRGKQKRTKIFASHCPFCGERYPEPA